VGAVEASGDRVTWSYDATYQRMNERRSGVNSYNVTHVCNNVGNRTVKNDGGSRTTFTFDATGKPMKLEVRKILEVSLILREVFFEKINGKWN
jgi:hypothetical protein